MPGASGRERSARMMTALPSPGLPSPSGAPSSGLAPNPAMLILQIDFYLRVFY